MGQLTLDDVVITPLSKIEAFGGDILHALKKSDDSFAGFGEAYFSLVNSSEIKAWKKHNLQISNLIVPVGRVRFAVIDGTGQSKVVDLSPDNYFRLTIPPGFWFGFLGLGSGTNLILSVSNIEHDPSEVERKEKNEFDFDWGLIS